MELETTLINRVAESDLQTIALDEYMVDSAIVEFDLKDFLFQGLILREKDFREALKNIDWSAYTGKYLAVYCSTDAIIPMWAYMLISSQAIKYTKGIYFGTKSAVSESILIHGIESKDWSYLQDKRVVIKGCSDQEIPAAAYLTISKKLQPYVQSLMYGEPCSTVPIYKRPREIKN
jgi:hypothetical protein